MLLPSPILIFGDYYLSRNNLLDMKKEEPNAKWVELSLDKATLDDVRTEVGMSLWSGDAKVVLVYNVPNQKAVREFLLDVCASLDESVRLVIWDSLNNIKYNKTCQSFLDAFKEIPNSKLINNGDKLTEKDGEEAIEFVKKCFQQHGKRINYTEAKMLVGIVGYNRGLLASEVDKLCVLSPEIATADFILENAYPSNDAAVLYMLSNVVDTGSYHKSVEMAERFMQIGVNENVLAEVLVKKGRWQLAAAYFWAKGMSWSNVINKLMTMGKFPSIIWHSDRIKAVDKKEMAADFQDKDGMKKMLVRKLGIPEEYFGLFKKEAVKIEEPPKKGLRKKKATLKASDKIKSAEKIPMSFMAEQTVNFVKDKLVGPNQDNPYIKQQLVARAVRVYLFAQDKLAKVRYGTNPMQHIEEMLAALTSVRMEKGQ